MKPISILFHPCLFQPFRNGKKYGEANDEIIKMSSFASPANRIMIHQPDSIYLSVSATNTLPVRLFPPVSPLRPGITGSFFLHFLCSSPAGSRPLFHTPRRSCPVYLSRLRQHRSDSQVRLQGNSHSEISLRPCFSQYAKSQHQYLPAAHRS